MTYALTPAQVPELKQRMLNWSKQFSILLFLDNNNYPSPYAGYECLLAAGMAGDALAAQDLTALQQLHDEQRDWMFGHICYDYKNELEPQLASGHPVNTGFPLFRFFIPQTVCYINREQTELTITSFSEPEAIYAAIMDPGKGMSDEPAPLPSLRFKPAVSRDSYLAAIAQLRQHISDGDCYEINFCTEGYCEGAEIQPQDVFSKLNALSPAPFAAYYRLEDRYMMSASPERYIKKEGSRILAQPIKGTARRDKNPVTDEAIKQALKNDIKERAENVMIVDLMRNDIARSCTTGSVQVDELFGIYTFPQVHQMISTVSGMLKPECALTDVLRYSFPMGSMTGAPKYKVMQLIEQYELSRRELFSGTVGYITPDGDMDFNVIIRSLFYNAATRYLCYQTGGAITYDSNPEAEWEEMRLKAWALEQIFS